jgi:hypothetical protein
MWHDIQTKFHEDWHGRSINIKALAQQFLRMECWYNRWGGSMKCAVEMGSGGMIYLHVTTIGLAIQVILRLFP